MDQIVGIVVPVFGLIGIGYGVAWTRLPLSANLISAIHRVDIYVADSGSSPTSAPFTVSGYGSNQTGAGLIEFEVFNAHLLGGVLSAIVQHPTATGGPAGSGGSVTLAPAVGSRHRALSFFVHLENEPTSGRSLWIVETGATGSHSTPVTGYIGQYRLDLFETTASADWDTDSLWRGVALEIAWSDHPIPVGALTLSGAAPSLGAEILSVPTGSIGLTGLTPLASADDEALPVGSLDLTGQSVGVAFSGPSCGAITLAGSAPSVGDLPGTGVVPGVGAIALSGTYIRPTFGGLETGEIVLAGLVPGPPSSGVQPGKGALTLTGQAPSPGRGIVPPVGGITLTGQPGPVLATGPTPPAGLVEFTGHAPTLPQGMSVPVGLVILTGEAPSSEASGVLAVPVGEVTLSGQAPVADNLTTIAVPDGVITITGQAPVGNVDIPILAGSIALEGQAPTSGVPGTVISTAALAFIGQIPVVAHASLIPVGTVALDGQVPALAFGANPGLAAGAITLTGLAPSLGPAIGQDVGAIALAGLAPNTINRLGLDILAGAIAIDGAAPTLPLVVAAPDGTLVLAGWQPEPVSGAETIASPETAAITLTGAAPTIDFIVYGTSGLLALVGETPSIGDATLAVTGFLTLTGEAPQATVIVATDQAPSPGPGTLTLTGHAPTLDRTERVGRRWLRRSAHISAEHVRIRHDLFKLVMETGIGSPSTGQPTPAPNPTVQLRWSDDGGHTWSSYYAREAGPLGSYKRRVIWRRLGMARNRVYEVSGSDPVKIALIDAYLNPTVGEH